MYFHFPASPATLGAVDASWTHQPLAYLAVAAFCLLIALHFLGRALAPVRALIQAAAAAAAVAFAAALALAMLAATALTLR